jgi:hypothetical protein
VLFAAIFIFSRRHDVHSAVPIVRVAVPSMRPAWQAPSASVAAPQRGPRAIDCHHIRSDGRRRKGSTLRETAHHHPGSRHNFTAAAGSNAHRPIAPHPPPSACVPRYIRTASWSPLPRASSPPPPRLTSVAARHDSRRRTPPRRCEHQHQ